MCSKVYFIILLFVVLCFFGCAENAVNEEISDVTSIEQTEELSETTTIAEVNDIPETELTETTSEEDELLKLPTVKFREDAVKTPNWENDDEEIPIDPEEYGVQSNVNSINTKEDALEVIENFKENDWLSFWFCGDVMHYTKNNNWFFWYIHIDHLSEFNQGGIWLGNGPYLFIAVDGNNGEIIKMFHPGGNKDVWESMFYNTSIYCAMLFWVRSK